MDHGLLGTFEEDEKGHCGYGGHLLVPAGVVVFVTGEAVDEEFGTGPTVGGHCGFKEAAGYLNGNDFAC